MKRNLLSFAALTAAVLFSGSIFAQTEKASVSLEFNGEDATKQHVKAAVYDDYSFLLSVPGVNVAFDEIGVQINGQTQKTVTSSLSGVYFSLSEKLSKIYSFEGATIHATIEAGENEAEFSYNMAKVATDIVATTGDASAAFSLLKTYGEATGAQGGNLLIKKDSYINYGGKVLNFKKDFVGTKDIDVLFNNFQNATELKGDGDADFEMYLEKGSKLAIGNSGRAFMYPTTITMDIAGNGDALAALQTSSLSDFITNTLLFVNDLIGAIDTKNDVTLTIEIADPWRTLRGEKSILLEGKDHDLTVGEFGTFVSKFEISDFRGAEVYSINMYDGDGSSVDLVEVSAPLVAGRPYIFRATSDKLEGIEVGSPASCAAFNGLYPAYDVAFGDQPSSEYCAIPANEGWSIIKDNTIRYCGIGSMCGLYEGTAAIKLGEISSTPLVSPQHVGKHLRVAVSENAIEGIEDAQAEVAATKMIVNGQLVIVKNGVMYNAAGMQVK